MYMKEPLGGVQKMTIAEIRAAAAAARLYTVRKFTPATAGQREARRLASGQGRA